MPAGPFDLAGGPFLALYAALLVLAIIIAEIRRDRAGTPHPVTDPGQLAILAGGRARFADTIIVRLLEAGALYFTDHGQFAIDPRALPQGAAERSILRLPPPLRWPAIQSHLARHAAATESALIGAGLRTDERAAVEDKLRRTLPYVLLIGFGMIKLAIGALRDRPVGLLTLLLLLTVALAATRWFRSDRLTPDGRATLAAVEARRERLARGPAAGEFDEAVALFGTAVLAGSAFDAFHRQRTAGSGGGSVDGGSGDSGSGDGGGGCGGCS